MSSHYLVGAHNPAINTFFRNSGFIKQGFRLPVMLTCVIFKFIIPVGLIIVVVKLITVKNGFCCIIDWVCS
jgi:hypothetical protein